MARIALLFILLPIIDFYLLIQIGRSVGFWPPVAYVVGIGMLGLSLLRGNLGRLMTGRAQLPSASANAQAILDSLARLVAGILLIAPGPVSDVLALTLLFPPTRRILAGRLRRWADGQIRAGRMHMGGAGSTGVWSFSTRTTFGEGPTRHGGTIEGEPVEDEGPGDERKRLDPAKEIRLPRKDPQDDP